MSNKRRRTKSGSKPSFGYVSSNLLSEYNRKNSRNEDYSKLDDLEPLVKENAPGQLKELSSKIIKDEQLSQSMFAFIVVRDCEDLLKKYEESGSGDGITKQRDIVRLERRADDFVLSCRDKADCPHRMRLWVARCRLVLLLEKMRECEGVDEAPASSEEKCDSMHLASKVITDEMLAEWMADNEVGDSSVVRQNPVTDKWEHAIKSSGLSALWETIRSLRDRWPFLSLSPFLYVIVDKLRQRIAFFMMYRELLNEQIENERSQRSVKIIGLSRSAWKAVDPDWVSGSKYATGRQIESSNSNSNLTLLNSQDLTKTFGDKKPGAQRFICINDDLIEESERVLNNMLIEIRKCAGFLWHENCSSTEGKCLACKMSLQNEAELDSAKVNLEAIVTHEVNASFREHIQVEFRNHVWNYHLQPGEKEMFALYRPLDNQKGQSVISRGRPDDGKNINRRCCSRKIAEVWEDFTRKKNDDAQNNDDEILIDYTQKSDPTYAVLVRLALGFHLDSLSNGGRFVVYTIDCHESNQPFLFSHERFGKNRICLTEFHTNFVTTGTLKWRYKHQRRDGLDGPTSEQFYQHPLILKTMASFCVLYKEHMHLCDDFAEAFVLWVSIMCEDQHIGSETSSEFSLFSIYQKLFPSRADRIADFKIKIEKKKEKWEPYSRVFPSEVLKEKSTTFDMKSTLQY